MREVNRQADRLTVQGRIKRDSVWTRPLWLWNVASAHPSKSLHSFALYSQSPCLSTKVRYPYHSQGKWKSNSKGTVTTRLFAFHCSLRVSNSSSFFFIVAFCFSISAFFACSSASLVRVDAYDNVTLMRKAQVRTILHLVQKHSHKTRDWTWMDI